MKSTKSFFSHFLILLIVGFIFMTCPAKNAQAATGEEIDVSVKATLNHFYDEFREGKKLAHDAKGVLVFPNVIKAGFGIGGEFGEGALLIRGKTVDYYNTIAASLGFQIGAQKKSIILIFTQEGALDHFRSKSGWKAGVDASVAMVTVGAGRAMDTSKLNEPILGFIFGQEGLMVNLTLEGAKFTKIHK